MKLTRTRRFVTASAVGLMMIFGSAACAGGPATEPSSANADNEAAYEALPDSVKESGKLKFSSSFDYAPHAYIKEDGSQAGFDYEILNEIAERLGVETEWQSLTFGSMIPGVQSGRSDAAVDGMGILEDRLAAVSFVYYATGDVAILVNADNPTDVDPENLCGHKLTTDPAGSQITAYNAANEDCLAEGKPGLDIVLLEPTAGLVAVQSGQVEGTGIGTAVGHFMVEQNPDFDVVGPVPGWETPVGIILSNNQHGAQLGEAFVLVLQDMVEDGTLEEIAAANSLSDNVALEPMYVSTLDQLETLQAGLDTEGWTK